MATAKKLTTAGRQKVDPDVKDRYHDEVLNWMIDNLPDVVADRVGLSAESAEAALAQAKEQFDYFLREKVEALIARALNDKKLYSWQGEIELDASAQRGFQTAQENISAIRKNVSKFSLAEDEGDGKVQSFEVMKRVTHHETKPARRGYGIETKETPAGYVDLFASIFVPSGFRFKLDGVHVNDHGEISLYDQKSCVKFTSAIRLTALSLHGLGKVCPFFFSVRTDPFTLGEVLQELKELQNLEDGKQDVALVVDNIDPSIRRKIEAEGFMVFARTDYS